MFNTRNNFNGASFDYENEGCKASGEFRYAETVLKSVDINGNYTKDGRQYNFWAARDMNGNLNLNGVPKEMLKEVAIEIVAILDEIETLNSAE